MVHIRPTTAGSVPLLNATVRVVGVSWTVAWTPVQSGDAMVKCRVTASSTAARLHESGCSGLLLTIAGLSVNTNPVAGGCTDSVTVTGGSAKATFSKPWLPQPASSAAANTASGRRCTSVDDIRVSLATARLAVFCRG